MSKKRRNMDSGEVVGKKGRTNYLLVLGIVGFIVLSLYFYSMSETKADTEVVGAAVDTNAGSSGTSTNPDVVKIPLSEITDKVKKYTYNAGGTAVNYIVVLGSDGQVRTAFDACEVCGGRLGYRQERSDVACINCGRRFRINDLGTKNRGGGCWPGYLPHIIEDGFVVLKTSDLKDGGRYF